MEKLEKVNVYRSKKRKGLIYAGIIVWGYTVIICSLYLAYWSFIRENYLLSFIIAIISLIYALMVFTSYQRRKRDGTLLISIRKHGIYVRRLRKEYKWEDIQNVRLIEYYYPSAFLLYKPKNMEIRIKGKNIFQRIIWIDATEFDNITPVKALEIIRKYRAAVYSSQA